MQLTFKKIKQNSNTECFQESKKQVVGHSVRGVGVTPIWESNTSTHVLKIAYIPLQIYLIFMNLFYRNKSTNI